MKQGKKIMSFVWAILLFGFTAYAALDTFVIEHSYAAVEEPTVALATAAVTEEPETTASVTPTAVTTAAAVQTSTTPVQEAAPSPTETVNVV